METLHVLINDVMIQTPEQLSGSFRYNKNSYRQCICYIC